MEGRLEDDQDELEELLEKQRAHISHTSSLQSQLNEATIQIGELEESKIALESRVGLVCACLFVYHLLFGRLFNGLIRSRIVYVCNTCALLLAIKTVMPLLHVHCCVYNNCCDE